MRGPSLGGLQVSYRKAVRVLAEEFLAVSGAPLGDCIAAAEGVLSDALPRAQLARLIAQRTSTSQ